jgi:hypothetical protein
VHFTSPLPVHITVKAHAQNSCEKPLLVWGHTPDNQSNKETKLVETRAANVSQ